MPWGKAWAPAWACLGLVLVARLQGQHKDKIPTCCKGQATLRSRAPAFLPGCSHPCMTGGQSCWISLLCKPFYLVGPHTSLVVQLLQSVGG